MDKHTLLNQSKVFCMAPWTHMHVWPNGTAKPCCVTNSEQKYGNTHDNTIQELWNSESACKLRSDMLAGKPNEYCNHCYAVEKTNQGSLRTSLNKRFGEDHFDKVKITKSDGSHDEPNFTYMDIRFSNICNLKCRTCNPTWSSSWYDEYKKVNGSVPVQITPKKYTQITDKDKLLEEILGLIDTTEGVNWAGGEPFITEEHWTVMDHWVSTGKAKDIEVDYTTNFSMLKYKKRDLFELWSHFKQVRIHASLDGSWQRGEYLRKGLDWQQVIDNRKRMLEQAPHIQFEIIPTVSILNAMHLPDFHKEWLENGWIYNADHFRFNFLFSPSEFCLRNATNRYKKKVSNRWREHKRWLIDNQHSKPDDSIIQWIDGLEKFMYVKAEKVNMDKLLTTYDRVRDERWWQVFPELIDRDTLVNTVVKKIKRKYIRYRVNKRIQRKQKFIMD